MYLKLSLVIINNNLSGDSVKLLMLILNSEQKLFALNKEKFNAEVYEELLSKNLIYKINENFADYIPFHYFCTNETLKALDLIEESDWFDDWWDLFPAGKRNKSGKYIKSGKSASKSRLKSFCNSHKDYSKELIFKATENYIDTNAVSGFMYMHIVPYFILKDGISTLESFCEAELQKYDTTFSDTNLDVI
jgi:hypothetical protein